MYLNNISISNFRSFRKTKIDFIHPQVDFNASPLEKPKLRNINLLLGDNGFGKTSLLRAIALACLGPAVGRAGIFPYRFIRREPIREKSQKNHSNDDTYATIDAGFIIDSFHRRNAHLFKSLQSNILIQNKGDLEMLEWNGAEDDYWDPIFKAEADALFFVGYGATRRVEQKEREQNRKRIFSRGQRIQGLFEEGHTLIPLNAWFHSIEKRSRRWTEIVELINRLIGRGHYAFTGELQDGEYLFEKRNLKVPFPALSDGYRGYLGWICDLIYHIYRTNRNAKGRLDEATGIVMVDEIDLHLHPKWQMTVLPTLSAALPNIQFIVTSHSPLLVGSIERSNIITMKSGINQSSRLVRSIEPVHGLDADQVLLTDYFGLATTRAPSKARELTKLTVEAREGNPESALKLLRLMRTGSEAEE